MQVFKIHTTVDTNFPVTHADCELTVKLVTSPACIEAMEWSGMGIILGDSYGRFYILRDDSVLVMNTAGFAVQMRDGWPPTRCYDAALPEPCSGPVSEVFIWRSH